MTQPLGIDLRERKNTWASPLSFEGCNCPETVPVEVWVRDARHVLNGVESYDLWREYSYRCQGCRKELRRVGVKKGVSPL